jgi:hypothetical protein
MRVVTLVAFLASPPLFGSILFSDYSESGSSSEPKWAVEFTEVVTGPLSVANDVLHFTGFGSRADLLSLAIPYVSLYAPSPDLLQIKPVSINRPAYPDVNGLSAGSWQQVQLLFSFSP